MITVSGITKAGKFIEMRCISLSDAQDRARIFRFQGFANVKINKH
jgi:hypothetical protein